MSLAEIKCPMCKGTLWIDLTSGKVVDHHTADHQKKDFDDFLKSRKTKTQWDDKFQKAKEDEAKRKAAIEEKFKKAKENQDTTVDPFKSPLDWD